jgi:hypothetical protein
VDKPLVLIDVDGPLNPYGAKPTRRPEGYTTIRVQLPMAIVARVPSAERRTLRVWLNPEHGPMLLAFAEKHDAELVWATTWEHDANIHIGPVIGLPELPVIEWGFKAHHWKFDGVLDYVGTRPFVWFDDDFGCFPMERHWFEGKRGRAPGRLHWVDPKIGLTQNDLDVAGEWLDDLKENDV